MLHSVSWRSLSLKHNLTKAKATGTVPGFRDCHHLCNIASEFWATVFLPPMELGRSFGGNMLKLLHGLEE